jgi:hypothetical protein
MKPKALRWRGTRPPLHLEAAWLADIRSIDRYQRQLRQASNNLDGTSAWLGM